RSEILWYSGMTVGIGSVTILTAAGGSYSIPSLGAQVTRNPIQQWRFGPFRFLTQMPGSTPVCPQRGSPSRHRSQTGHPSSTDLASRDEQVEHMWLTVLAFKHGERQGVLDELCAADSELRRMVEEKLAEDEEMGSFLEHSPLEFLRGAMGHTVTARGHAAEVA